MKLLGIETSSDIGSVALKVGEEVDQRLINTPKEQTLVILPLIEEMLIERNMSISDLDAIAFGVGPGSFTGIRVATALAQGLGYSASLPLLPVSSLATLAQGYKKYVSEYKALVCVDAKMNEIFWGIYNINQGVAFPLIDEKLSRPKDIFVLDDSSYICIGNAFKIYDDLLLDITSKADRIFPDSRPYAKDLFPKAILDYEKGLNLNPGDIIPNYFRDNSAWINN